MVVLDIGKNVCVEGSGGLVPAYTSPTPGKDPSSAYILTTPSAKLSVPEPTACGNPVFLNSLTPGCHLIPRSTRTDGAAWGEEAVSSRDASTQLGPHRLPGTVDATGEAEEVAIVGGEFQLLAGPAGLAEYSELRS